MVRLAIAAWISLSSSSDYEKQGDTWYLKVIGQRVPYLFIKVLDTYSVLIASSTKVEKLNTPAEGMVKYCKIFFRKKALQCCES